MPDNIDRLLDEALSTYAVAPERHGLEERVLARVHEHTCRRRYWFAYAAAAAVIGGLLIVPLLRSTRNRLPSPKISEIASNYTEPPTTRQPVCAPSAMLSTQPVRRRPTVAKRREFRALPLTRQERALLEIVQFHPAQLAALNRPMEPLEVPPIQIEPLDEGKN